MLYKSLRHLYNEHDEVSIVQETSIPEQPGLYFILVTVREKGKRGWEARGGIVYKGHTIFAGKDVTEQNQAREFADRNEAVFAANVLALAILKEADRQGDKIMTEVRACQELMDMGVDPESVNTKETSTERITDILGDLEQFVSDILDKAPDAPDDPPPAGTGIFSRN